MTSPRRPAAGDPTIPGLPLDAGPVRLRPLTVGDLDAFLAYRGDPEVARYQGWSPMSRGEARAFLAEMEQAASSATLAPWPEGEWVQIAIARTDTDRLVGDIGLLHEAPGQVQLGFTLARQAQGRGWAQAALRPLCEGLLAGTRGRCLRAIGDSRNAASLRLLARLGFVETGREAVIVRGEACTDVILELSTGKEKGPGA